MARQEFGGKLGEEFPNIEAPSTFGVIKLHDYWGDGWGEQLAPISARSEPLSATAVHQSRLGLRAPLTRLGAVLAAALLRQASCSRTRRISPPSARPSSALSRSTSASSRSAT